MKDTIITIKIIISCVIALTYVIRMYNNINFLIKAKIDFKCLTQTMKNNGKKGKTVPGSFDSPESDLNKFQIENDKNRQAAANLISEKTKDIFYDTVYAAGVFGILWLNFESWI